MTRYLRIPLIALGLLAFAGAALAQTPARGCPHNDRLLPDKSNICRDMQIWICADGKWVRQEGTRCSPRN